VRSAGYESARTTDAGFNDLRTDPYRLRVVGTRDDDSLNVLAGQLAGVPVFRRLLKS
jgi:hypothetical protein